MENTFGVWLAIVLKSTRRMRKKVKDRPIIGKA